MYTPQDAFAMDQHYPPIGYQHPYGMSAYAQQPVAGPSFAPLPFHPQYIPPTINDNFQFGNSSENEWQGNADWDEDEYQDGQDLVYGNLKVSDQAVATVPMPRKPDVGIQKVKHRRRTSPDQLKVLGHWFDINPKPDNNLREWLAAELGMTKRNVQVWFQNR